ncbi:hypothetical protein [Luteolibacter soli]|uniref:DUF4034 domain-containing protein n=1 Tax=Luteolibacter soli TaxID=3135280 RepID=A0ABU9AZQ1_9BACT
MPLTARSGNHELLHMLPRPLLLIGCFILAMFAGWMVRQAKDESAKATDGSSASAAPSMPPMPEGMDDLATRIWLADHLTDSNSTQLADIATRLTKVPELDDKAWHGLFSCWFEKDPSAAWAFASTEGAQRNIALEEWAAFDTTAARAALASPSATEWTALVNGALQKDMAKAFLFLEEALAAGATVDVITAGHFQNETNRFAEFASQDPDAAEAWLKRFGLYALRGQLLWGRWMYDPASVQKWLAAQENPAGCLDGLSHFIQGHHEHYRPALMDLIADAYPVGNARNSSIQLILESLAFHDPDFAAKEAARVIPDATMRAESLGRIASVAAFTDFTKAWAILGAVDPATEKKGLQRLILPHLEVRPGSETGDPHALSNYSDAIRNFEFLSPAGIKSQLLAGLMDTDAAEAIHHLDIIPARNFWHSGRGAFESWAGQDPDTAIPWLARKLGHADDIVEAVSLLPRDWPDTEALPDLIATLPEGSVRDVLVGRAVEKLVKTDPLAALDYARSASQSAEPVTDIYHNWASADSQAALMHLATDASATPADWEAVCGKAFSDDPGATAEAIAVQAEGSAREAAIRSIVTATADTDPLQAAPWAAALHDPDMRRHSLETVFNALGMDLRLAHDPKTLESLQEIVATLPPGEQEHWQERINREFATP